MIDYEIDDESTCPECGNEYIHYRTCNHCEDGFIDEYEDDAINYAPHSEYRRCSECLGTGLEQWCPKCGADLTDVDCSSQKAPDNIDYWAERMQWGRDGR